MKPTVYLARLDDGASVDEQAEALARAVKATGFAGKLGKRDMTMIKVHVGEHDNETRLQAELAAAAVKLVKAAKGLPFITDTSTLYKGNRENGILHALHAHAHGFSVEKTGAPFIPVDGLSGNFEAEVEIRGELHEKVKIAGDVLRADALVVLSHATGHMGCGMGASLKNAGMGLSSRSGKMRQHSTVTPSVVIKRCTNCGKCRKWCPTDAISEREGVSYIAQNKCIGCGECIAVCRFGAVSYNYAIESVTLQKSMAEHAAGAIRHFGAKAVFINVMTGMTKDCDCMNSKQKKAMPDLGVAASLDVVALDQATLDLTRQAQGKSLSELAFPHLDPEIQIDHAEKLGLGSKDYTLKEV